jgi:ankyrin repeat protein
MRLKGAVFLVSIVCFASASIAARDPEVWKLAKIFLAVQNGDASAVERAIVGGLNPDVVGPQGASLLAMAISTKHKEVALLLLKHGADPSAPVNAHCLKMAAENADLEMVKRLVEGGAKINLPEESVSYQTALLAAIVGGKNEVVEYLLVNGADPNDHGRMASATALMYAASFGNLQAVRMLLSCGALINDRDTIGRTALMHACERGQTEAITLLLENGADPTIQDGYDYTAADWAKIRGHSEVKVLCAGKREAADK